MRVRLYRWVTAFALALLFKMAGWWFKRFDDIYPEEGSWL